ncbi:SDR family oxidoreductase [Paraferrimonas sp. SM1919]|uniref:SDR family oxidoreductase n=1 Tax=Paraferrimonas sp. SM1919 TaxID=2662263 RepID=UPI0013D1C10D|nr:SDR family oxidoreductase [Paraferrimonas sp. SM1919]
MARLKGKIAVVTGAAKGIGEAISTLFVKQGASVILTDIDDEKGSQLAQKLGKFASYQHLDVSSPSQWQLLKQSVLETYGYLDILVNNAGIIGFDETPGSQDPEHFEYESWCKIHEVNIGGVALGCKVAIELMKASKAASIINLSSRSGIVGIPSAAAYASSKAAIRNHTKTVALYCAQQGYRIRCNSIHPGAILTPLWESMLDKDNREKSIKTIAKGIPLGHMGEPDDVAYGALYLASEESKYLTGIELNIDGGILAGSTAAPTSKD